MVQDVIAQIEKDIGFYNQTIDGNPIWDGIRYDIISFINAHEITDAQKKTDSKSLSLFAKIKYFFLGIWSVISLTYLPMKRKDYLFVISSRFKEGKQSYDRQIAPILPLIDKEKRIIIEHHIGAKYDDSYYMDGASLFYRVNKFKYRKRYDISEFFADNINKHYGRNVISSSVVNTMINRFFSNRDFYFKLLSNIKPSKIIISYGRFKSMCAAASKLRTPVFLLQHALVFENDYALSNTCPNKGRGYFPNYLLTYGSYWGKYMDHLTEVKVLGNKYLSEKLKSSKGESILFISTSQQGIYLSPVVKQFAEANPEVPCLYRLHPTEYSIKDKYDLLFNGCPNVKVITTELTFEDSLAESRFVVGIFSTTLFESLHQERPVAVLNIDKYQTYLTNLKSLANVYFFNDYRELSDIINNTFIKTEMTFFEPLNENTLSFMVGLKC